MAAEENGHRRRLIDLFVVEIRRPHPAGAAPGHPRLHPAKPVWHMRPLGLDTVRAQAREMERAAARFYRQALTRATDASTRKLLGDLAEEEEKHDQIAAGLEEQILTTSARGDEAENERRRFVLQIIQPGLVGLMDGRCRRSRRCSPRPSRPTIPGTRFWSVSRPRSAPAFRWASPRRCRTTASFRDAARRCCAASSAA